MSDKGFAAVAVLNNENVTGVVKFTQAPNSLETKVSVELTINGSAEQRHGFHIHQFGDATNGCISAGPHFNPMGQTHGDRHSETRHFGDLGNVKTDAAGKVSEVFNIKNVPLHGENSVIGRSIVVHKNTDDLGQGGDAESLKTGNAGPRIACAVIGHADYN